VRLVTVASGIADLEVFFVVVVVLPEQAEETPLLLLLLFVCSRDGNRRHVAHLVAS